MMLSGRAKMPTQFGQGSRRALRSLTVVAAVCALLVTALAGIDQLRAEIRQGSKTTTGDGDFSVYDTPQATLLVDRSSGNVWRIGYTEVAGQRYWFGTYVPREPPTEFKEFQSRVHKAIRSAPRE